MENLLFIELSMGKSSINRGFSSAMFGYQRVTIAFFRALWRQLRPVTAFYGFNTFTTLADLQGLFSKGRSLGSTILKTLRSLQSIHITHTHTYIYIIYNVCIIYNPKPSQMFWWFWHIKKAFYQVTYLTNKHQSHVRNHQAVPSHGVLAKAGHYSVTTLERSKFTVL